MDWKDRRRSSHVEDRRGRRGGVGGGYSGGGIGGPLLGFGGIGGLILFLLLNFVGGGGGLFGPGQEGAPQQGPQTNYTYETADQDELFDYVSVILADTEDIWSEVLQEYGQEYKDPDLVVYTEAVQSACGVSSSQ